MEQEKITVIGGGSWGSAIANLLAQKGIDTTLFILEKEQYDWVVSTRTNPKYLKDFTFDKQLHFSNDLKESLTDCSMIVIGVPSHATRTVLCQIQQMNLAPRPLVNLSKGFEEETHMRMSEIAEEVLPEFPFVTLSGPSHAEEVSKNIPTAIVACSTDEKWAKKSQEIFTTETMRVYAQDDMVGVEMGGALKNIIALAAGLTDGLGFGDNTKAALMTRGIYEIEKLGVAMGARRKTFHGLTGIGDLIVTCTSVHSRNWQFGNLIGQGKSAEEAFEEVQMVVEGVKATKAAFELAKEKNISMPITEKLYAVLYEGHNPRAGLMELMTRNSKSENEDVLFSE